MGIELGRISGSLLASNLLRKGSGLGEENLAFETDLLYLDVINGRVGINTSSPSSGKALQVNSDIRTIDLVVPDELSTPNFVFGTNRIQNLVSTIYLQPNQASDPTIVTRKVGTANLNISDLLIENIINNSDIELSPNGTGQVVITSSELRVNGDLHSTGNITFDGTITFGSDSSDNIVFSADTNSSIIPNVDISYDLGSDLQRWKTFYIDEISTADLNLGELTINNVDLLLTQGNTIYVSVNGDDSYIGTHLHNTFRTIKHALSQATSGDTIVIFPGTYEEEFPLTVPAGVTVNGTGIRAVKVVPTYATNTNNGFLLNGETTVSNLTIGNFYYDSDLDTGYGFAFAPSFTVTTRSPYVQNVTIITTTDDPAPPLQVGAGGGGPPLFSTSLAGYGALVDGSLANNASNQASMLFHSVTMIIPGAVGVTATNGARVEWLDCFTYYAEKGIYLTQGTLGFAGLGLKFGAELRSIGSANVYGTYGAVADGANTIGYLIGHNFGYIGSGTDSTNDQQLVVQANEIVELNNGRIYYESVDHKGDFRLGDIFYVNQDTGAVVFNAQSISFLPNGSITLSGPSSSAYIDYSMVQVGNIKIHDNNIDSLLGPVNFLASSGNTYLDTDVFVTGNTNITADVKVKGNIFLGDTPYDTVTVYPLITQDLLPDDAGGPFDLGSSAKRWNTLFVDLVNVDNLTELANNTISTLTLGTDLEFSAAGSGFVNLSNSDVQIDTTLTVGSINIGGTTSFQAVEITGITTQTGNINQTGDAYITGDLQSASIVVVPPSWIESAEIKIQGTTISVKTTNTDLSLQANGTGGIIFDRQLKISSNVIANVFDVNDISLSFNNVFVTEDGQLIWLEDESDILLTDQKDDRNLSVIFEPHGTGNMIIDSDKALAIAFGTAVLELNGEIRQNTDGVYEGFSVTGNVSFTNLYDTDHNTYITPELTPGYNDNILRFGINGAVKGYLDSTKLYNNTLYSDNVKISGNQLSNLNSSTDLELTTTGTGVLYINGIEFKTNDITNQLDNVLLIQSTGTGYVKFAGTGGLVIPTGDEASKPATAEVAQTRYNTELGYLETWNGTAWVSSTGASNLATYSEVEEVMSLWSLILG